MAAITAWAKKNGADAVEFDVDYTSDGVAVVIHDGTVDRTTDSKGVINHMRLQEVRKCNVSAKHSNRCQFDNEKIPTMDEVIELCLQLKLKMYIDVKTNAKKTVNMISALCEKYPDLHKEAIVCSFYPHIIYMVKRNIPQIITGLTHRSYVLSTRNDQRDMTWTVVKKLFYPFLDIILEWSHYAWLWFFCGNSAFLVHNGDVSRRMINHFHQRGVQVVVWTVNDAAEKHYLTSSIKCSYMTDTLYNSPSI